ncbi:MAG: HD domain-containing protein [Bryobacteraceae bacterium]|nr:HD domain-containing protein [Bryobacteraceae bacterium]
MKSPYVADLQANQVVTGTFLVQSKDIRQKKTGEPYLSLILTDRTGELDAKMWDNVGDVMETFGRDDFIRTRGLVQVHHNRLQLTIQKLQKVDESSVEFADYFPASKRDPEEMFRELRATVNAFTNEHLKALLNAMLDDGEIARLYRIAPAAKSMHHAYLGGLLEHVLSMCALAKMTGPHYNADLDLLLTGVVLHDIGKIHELTYDRSFGYSVEGHLLGHMFIGMRMMDEKIRAIPGFPPKLRMLIEHMILSHHGELEFGSPKQPLFTEALLLHYIDNMDSKMEAMRHAQEKDRSIEGFFTGYTPALERQVFRTERYLKDEPAAPGAPAPAPAPQSAPRTAPPSRTPSSSPFAQQLQKALTKDVSKD